MTIEESIKLILEDREFYESEGYDLSSSSDILEIIEVAEAFSDTSFDYTEAEIKEAQKLVSTSDG